MKEATGKAPRSLGELHAAIERLADAGDRVPGRIRDEDLEEVANLRHLLAQAEQAQAQAHSPAEILHEDQVSLRLGVKQAIDQALVRFGSPD
jgi:hypothetical protein